MRLPDRSRLKGSERGFVLVVVMWTLGLLALMAISFTSSVQTQIKVTAGAVENARLEALADAGFNLALHNLARARQERGRTASSAIDGSIQACDAGDGTRILVSLEDEAGKISLAVGNERLYAAFFRGLGLPPEDARAITDSFLDFRDADDVKRPYGAERLEYLAAGRTAGPKNAAPAAAEELEQVLGFSPELVARIRPHVSFHSEQAGLDPAVTSPALMEIVAGGFPFLSSSGMGAALDPGARARLPSEFVATSGKRLFRIRSDAVSRDGSRFARLAVVELSRSRSFGYQVREWRRASEPLNPPAGGDDTTLLPPC